MIRYAEALRRIRQAAAAAGLFRAEDVVLAGAAGRVTAARLVSLEDLPRWDNSAMDGYAVRAADAPGRLPVAASVSAGDQPPRSLARGTACEIMTGAPLPAGADAIVPVELAERDDGLVRLPGDVSRGDYVRRAGRDFKAGSAIVEAGTALETKHLLALAALGAAKVPVRRRPRVAVLSTGRELVAPGKPPKPGQIRDATSLYLMAELRRLGCEARFHGVVRDDPSDFKRRMKKILREADVILTTGAVSMGKHDFVAAAVQELGAELLYHKVAIRPGKPGLVARFPRWPVVFGLPGNPISTVAGLRFFVRPYLRERLGLAPERPLRVKLEAACEKPAGLRCFFKARLSMTPEGVSVRVLPGQGSFQIHSLLAADGWAVLPEAGRSVRAGAVVEYYPG